MSKIQKRILSLQDFSCFGKCSQTVALPILSALGHETVSIPTAVFSTHTMFKDFYVHDLTEDILPICEHYKKENFVFDAIVIGYLCEGKQCEVIEKVLDMFKGTKIYLDPAMADNGKLYPCFTEKHVEEIKRIAVKAELILPNITEACLLLGEKYKDSSVEFCDYLLEKFEKQNVKNVVITGVEIGKDVGAIGKYNGKRVLYTKRKEAVSFHGTGDIFTSVFVGEFLRSEDFEKSIKTAVDFTADSIKKTQKYADEFHYGVLFEKSLKMLVK